TKMFLGLASLFVATLDRRAGIRELFTEASLVSCAWLTWRGMSYLEMNSTIKVGDTNAPFLISKIQLLRKRSRITARTSLVLWLIESRRIISYPPRIRISTAKAIGLAEIQTVA